MTVVLPCGLVRQRTLLMAPAHRIAGHACLRLNAELLRAAAAAAYPAVQCPSKVVPSGQHCCASVHFYLLGPSPML